MLQRLADISRSAALIPFGKSLAHEWREFARVNSVSPVSINTKMGANEPEKTHMRLFNTDLARAGDLKELKGAYLYLATMA